MKQVEQELARLDSNVYSSTTEAQKKERYAGMFIVIFIETT